MEAGKEKWMEHGVVLSCVNWRVSITIPFEVNAVYEVDMNGNIVWIWSFKDHLAQSYDPTKANYVADVGTVTGKLDINVNSNVHLITTYVDWNHINSMDYNAQLGQIVINSRNMNEFYVIDHDNTFVSTTSLADNVAAAASSAGDFLYRWGSANNYNRGGSNGTRLNPSLGSNGVTQIWGAHDIQWIRPTAYTGGPALPCPAPGISLFGITTQTTTIRLTVRPTSRRSIPMCPA
jgi:hypothetical protein